VLERLTASNIRNYPIFRDGLTLFSYLEYGGDDLATDPAKIAVDEMAKRWWVLTQPLQRLRHGLAGDEWLRLPGVFHLD
jgi:L-rhamnose mutarotase